MKFGQGSQTSEYDLHLSNNGVTIIASADAFNCYISSIVNQTNQNVILIIRK